MKIRAPILILWFGIMVLNPRLGKLILVNLAVLPGPPGLMDNTWGSIDSSAVTDTDVRYWPFSVH